MELELSKFIAAFGLFLDIIGALLIFVFPAPKHDYGLTSDPVRESSGWDSHGPRAKTGIALLILGFSLQLFGALVS